MKFNVECWKLRLAALVIVTSLLSACATGSSEPVIGVCPPAVEYDDGFQVQAAEELLGLSKGSAITGMLIDYLVLRKQVYACNMRAFR